MTRRKTLHLPAAHVTASVRAAHHGCSPVLVHVQVGPVPPESLFTLFNMVGNVHGHCSYTILRCLCIAVALQRLNLVSDIW